LPVQGAAITEGSSGGHRTLLTLQPIAVHAAPHHTTPHHTTPHHTRALLLYMPGTCIAAPACMQHRLLFHKHCDACMMTCLHGRCLETNTADTNLLLMPDAAQMVVWVWLGSPDARVQHREPYRLTYALGSADGGEGPARVAMLLRQNPTAGRAFCASLLQGAPVERVVELVAALRDHLLSSAPAQDSALAAAEAGPSKGRKRRRGRKQAKAVAGSPGQPEEASAEVGYTCLSMLQACFRTQRIQALQ